MPQVEESRTGALKGAQEPLGAEEKKGEPGRRTSPAAQHVPVPHLPLMEEQRPTCQGHFPGNRQLLLWHVLPAARAEPSHAVV